MAHSFNLNWDDLDEETQAEKINEVMEHENENNGDDYMTPEQAEDFIKAHFPIHF